MSKKWPDKVIVWAYNRRYPDNGDVRKGLRLTWKGYCIDDDGVLVPSYEDVLKSQELVTSKEVVDLVYDILFTYQYGAKDLIDVALAGNYETP